jgi:hypothetical protein
MLYISGLSLLGQAHGKKEAQRSQVRQGRPASGFGVPEAVPRGYIATVLCSRSWQVPFHCRVEGLGLACLLPGTPQMPHEQMNSVMQEEGQAIRRPLDNHHILLGHCVKSPDPPHLRSFHHSSL